MLNADEVAQILSDVSVLQHRVAILEQFLATAATKQDVKTLEENLADVLTILRAGSGIYRLILILGSIGAAIVGISAGFRELIHRIFP